MVPFALNALAAISPGPFGRGTAAAHRDRVRKGASVREYRQLGGDGCCDGVDNPGFEVDEAEAVLGGGEPGFELREVALADLRVDVDLADAEGDRTGDVGVRDPRGAVERERDVDAFADRAQPLPVELRRAAYLPWTFPMETARQSQPVAATNQAASSGSVSEPASAGSAASSPPSTWPSSASTPASGARARTEATKDALSFVGSFDPSAITALAPAASAASISSPSSTWSS